MKNTVTILNAQRNIKISREMRKIITLAADETLEEEHVDYPCEISVKIVTDAAIRKLNRTFRDTDCATDVLSFPADEPLPAAGQSRYLGDMAIAVSFAKRQAEAAGGSLEHEIALLTSHSVLHLLGYDHAEADEEKVMFGKQDRAVQNVFARIRENKND